MPDDFGVDVGQTHPCQDLWCQGCGFWLWPLCEPPPAGLEALDPMFKSPQLYLPSRPANSVESHSLLVRRKSSLFFFFAPTRSLRVSPRDPLRKLHSSIGGQATGNTTGPQFQAETNHWPRATLPSDLNHHRAKRCNRRVSGLAHTGAGICRRPVSRSASPSPLLSSRVSCSDWLSFLLFPFPFCVP